jgi:hypothetical protein
LRAPPVDILSAAQLSGTARRIYSDAGWELKLEEGHAVCWQEIYADWHRVERRMTMMLKEVSELLEQGWTIAPANR